MINTVLCEICEEGFAEAKKEVDGKKVVTKRQQRKNIKSQMRRIRMLLQQGGPDTASVLRKAGKEDVSVTLSNVLNNPSDSGKLKQDLATALLRCRMHIKAAVSLGNLLPAVGKHARCLSFLYRSLRKWHCSAINPKITF